MTASEIHVLLWNRRWAVVRAGEQSPDSLHDRRADAIERARAMARESGADVVVFDLGGETLERIPGQSR